MAQEKIFVGQMIVRFRFKFSAKILMVKISDFSLC